MTLNLTQFQTTLKQIHQIFNSGAFYFLVLIVLPLLVLSVFFIDKSLLVSFVFLLLTVDAALGLTRSDSPNICWSDIKYVKVQGLKRPYVFGRYVFADKLFDIYTILKISNFQHDCGFFVYLILYGLEYIFRLGKSEKISFNCVSGIKNYDWLLYLLKIKR